MLQPSRALLALALLGLAAAKVDWKSLSDRQQHYEAISVAQAGPRDAFAGWVDHFQKVYKDVQEYEHRFAVWADNLDFIHSYNQKHDSHWLGLNHLADWTHEEYKQHFLGYRPELRGLSAAPTTPFMYANSSPPVSVDWRKNGSVTPVKNQAQCGSCWAFSTTGSIEGANAIFTGKLLSLSEQELVDCDVSRDHGCHGGLMDFAFTFVIQNGGLDTESDYKYIAEEEKCTVRKRNRRVVTIDSYEDVPPNDEKALQKAVAGQPISVAIEADQREFQLYQGGIFDGECGTALDHGVLVVGYGTEHGEDFWIVKNSWGPQWGDHGYIRLQRNVENSVGQCGIAMQASYPVKKTANPPEPAPTPPSPPKPHPPPSPKPVACDASVSCPAGSTCCCQRDFFGYCLSWACCPLVNAVCCDDQQHCCPHNLPVCDTAAGRCLSGQGLGFDDSVPWSTKFPASKIHDSRTWLPKLPFANTLDGAFNSSDRVLTS